MVENTDPINNWTDFDKTFNLLLSLSGVKTNAEQNKKERQTRTEITSKDLFTEQCKYTSNQMRDIAIDECKEIFGLNLSYEDVVEEKIKEETIEYAKALYTAIAAGGAAVVLVIVVIVLIGCGAAPGSQPHVVPENQPYIVPENQPMMAAEPEINRK